MVQIIDMRESPVVLKKEKKEKNDFCIFHLRKRRKKK